MNDRTISVIIPVYNVEKYLRKCLDSVLNQTHQSLEIVLVDDGATDKSGQICDEYASVDARVKVVHKANGGLSDARNTGLVIASGQYITFLDSDDYILPEMYEKLLRAVLENEADIAMTNFEFVDENGKTISEKNAVCPYKKNIYSGFQIVQEMESSPLWYYYVLACNKLYRSELFSLKVFPAGKLHEDEFIIPDILFHAKKVVVTDEMNYKYVQRNNSIMGKKELKGDLDVVEAFLMRVEKYQKSGLNDLVQTLQKRTMLLLSEISLRKKELIYEEKQRLRVLHKKYKSTVNLKELPCKRRLTNIAFFLIPESFSIYNSCCKHNVDNTERKTFI